MGFGSVYSSTGQQVYEYMHINYTGNFFGVSDKYTSITIIVNVVCQTCIILHTRTHNYPLVQISRLPRLYTSLTKFTLTVRAGLYSFTIPALFTKTSIRPRDSIHSFTAPVRNIKGKSQNIHCNTGMKCNHYFERISFWRYKNILKFYLSFI